MYRPRSRNTPLYPANFRLGMWAWVFQRVTGLGIVVYLVMHILVISSSLQGGARFDSVLHFLESRPFIPLEIILLAGIIFHAVNGVRIVLFDLGVGVRSQKQIFWSAMGVGAVLFALVTWKAVPLLVQ